MPCLAGTEVCPMVSETERVVYLQGFTAALFGHLADTGGDPARLDLDPPACPITLGPAEFGWLSFAHADTRIGLLVGADHQTERLLIVGGCMCLVGRWDWAVPLASVRSAFPEETESDAQRLVEAAVTAHLEAP